MGFRDNRLEVAPPAGPIGPVCRGLPGVGGGGLDALALGSAPRGCGCGPRLCCTLRRDHAVAALTGGASPVNTLSGTSGMLPAGAGARRLNSPQLLIAVARAESVRRRPPSWGYRLLCRSSTLPYLLAPRLHVRQLSHRLPADLPQFAVCGCPGFAGGRCGTR